MNGYSWTCPIPIFFSHKLLYEVWNKASYGVSYKVSFKSLHPIDRSDADSIYFNWEGRSLLRVSTVWLSHCCFVDCPKPCDNRQSEVEARRSLPGKKMLEKAQVTQSAITWSLILEALSCFTWRRGSTARKVGMRPVNYLKYCNLDRAFEVASQMLRFWENSGHIGSCVGNSKC